MYGDSELWQSGEFGVYAVLLFRVPSMIGIYPLLCFSGAALAKHIFRYQGSETPTWTLAAVLSGLILWVELYVVWCGAVSEEIAPDAALIVTFMWAPMSLLVSSGVFAAIATAEAVKVRENLWSWKGLATLLGVVVGGLLLAGFPVTFLIAMVVACPLAGFAYGWATWEIFRAIRGRLRVSLAALLIAVAWLSYNFAAWRYAVLRAVEAYQKLPTEDPSCFIATAAARGHMQFVGSRDVGRSYRVTNQLEYLKAFELLLRSTCPHLHGRLRRIYNRVGPAVARRIRSPWVADAVYLLLKPLEWMAWTVVRVVARVPGDAVRGLYRRL